MRNQQNIKTPSILLADLDKISRERVERYFTEAGWECDVVTDPLLAVEAVSNQNYDLVVADLEMPGSDSLALLAQIKSSRPTQAMIAIRSEKSSDDESSDGSCVTDKCISRPIDFGWLDRLVRELTNFTLEKQTTCELYRFVQSERTEFRFSCRDLARIESISLPIVQRLVAGKLISFNEALHLKLAVQEAVTNAMEHGNLELRSEWKEEINSNGHDRFSLTRQERLLDPDYSNRFVTICCWFDASGLEIRITDQGKGFLNDAVLPSGTPGDLQRCSGRGLSMMFSGVDEVKFSRNGAEVTLVKKLKRR